VAAFSLHGDDGQEQAVLVVETREKDIAGRERIVEEISRAIHEHFGINVLIDLTPRGTLPRTSSGKLSRSQSRQEFVARRTLEGVERAVVKVGHAQPA
jgi:fatty-acyl-CoA synthase